MTDDANGGKCTVVRYKKVFQVGANTIIGDEAMSVISTKVLCNRQISFDINRCVRCSFNDGLENQYLMRCKRPPSADIPIVDKTDIDYDEG